MVYTILALYFATAIHIVSAALVSRALGIVIHEVSIGIGPVIWVTGRWRWKAIPFIGYIKYPGVASELLEGETREVAFELQPVWRRIVALLSGCSALVLVALVLLQQQGWESFARGFSQVIFGALAPMTVAQQSLAEYAEFVESASFLAVLGVICAKVAAWNLLPLPTSNSGLAVLTLLAPRGLPEVWTIFLILGTFLIHLLMAASWAVALIVFVT